MEAIQCELCGNNQLIKKDGFFQCEYCGTKYTLEEAKKLIISGSVQIEGDVKTKDADFIIKAGTLERYNGESTVVTIPGNVKTIGSNAFSGLGVEKVVIPESVTCIVGWAFQGCKNLSSVTIPNSVSSIGDNAFYGCSSLTFVTIPNRITRIERNTFWYCTSLTSIIIPDSITSIGERAFWNCKSLVSITIPESVTSIGESAFLDCTALDPAQVQVPIFRTPIFDHSFLKKGYCRYCAGALKTSSVSDRENTNRFWRLFADETRTDTISRRECTRCGHQYDK